ncbi:MAG: cytochrome c maturation protein CcmE [Woeseiaceae bacterium]|jgi:cytochrome c-type biogenesis protein CcmE|nr:cytochrome c maturation protein CcmE [Woeseiaceae bacterium]|tara:strand:+ start:749 stop:1213 length:465 start_codon:yes stop_codon:yes gene_type:complete
MKPRQQRMLAVGLTVAGIAIAAMLTLQAFKDNMMFFVEISEVEKGNYPADRNFRVGGLVVEGSVQRAPGELMVAFDLTDLTSKLTVNYAGILPDLFREGQGIVAHGRLNDSGTFVADEVLAKHDENYMPPEVADSLAKAAAAQEAISKSEAAKQ